MSETFNEATGVDSFNCKVTNTSSKYVEVSMYLYFYDESGNIVDVCNFNGMSLNPKEKNNQLFDGPCIDNGNNGYTKGYKSYKFFNSRKNVSVESDRYEEKDQMEYQ